MKKNYRSLWLRSLTGLSLVITLFVTSSMIVLAAPGNALSGEIIVTGVSASGEKASALLNGEKAISGRTFFSSATISTPENSSAIINLGKLGRVNLSPNSNLILNLSDNAISGDLTAGAVKVYNSEGVSVNIKTKNDVITNDSATAGDVTVDVSTGTTFASNEVGDVYVNGEPAAAAKMSKRKRGWIIFGVIAAGVATGLIIYYATRDDEIVSPRR